MAPASISRRQAEIYEANNFFEALQQRTATLSPQQNPIVHRAATALTKASKRLLEETSPSMTQPTLQGDLAVNAPDHDINSFKRVMTSPILVNNANNPSEISGPANFMCRGIYQDNTMTLNSTINSSELRTTSGDINPLVIIGFFLMGIVIVGMILWSFAIWLQGRKAAKQAAWEKEQSETKERRIDRLARLKHVRVELKDLGEIMCPEKAV
ncbi:hypothetical protein ACEPPN_008102 [Leptodophora sp. 'Broadleaf-Isolate-01']